MTGQALSNDNFGHIRTTITTSHLSHYRPAGFAGIDVGDNEINAISPICSEQPADNPVAMIYLKAAVHRSSARNTKLS